MILNNYWKWLQVITMNGLNGQDCPCSIVNTNGDSLNTYCMSANNNINPCQLTKDLAIKIGTGENTYTPDSYNLVNDITSSIDNLTFQMQSNCSNDQFIRTVLVSGDNSSANDITITEIGIQRKMYRSAGGDVGTQVMLAIVQLETPITVPAGQGFTATVEWIEG